jgi:hypothetical protein
MSKTITITERVWPFQGRTLSVTLDGAGATCIVDPGEYDTLFFPWDKITDYTYLAEACRLLRVYEFEALCKALAEAHTLRAMIEIAPSGPALDAVASQQERLDYEERTKKRTARMDELAPRAGFDKMPGQRTEDEQAAWDEHERILREQLEDEQEQGL